MNIVRSQSGFSLIELSIVLVIIATLMAAGIVIGNSQISKYKYGLTVKKIKAIDNALTQFLAYNGRLPCPACISGSTSDACYGYEQISSGGAGSPSTCSNVTSYNISSGTTLNYYVGAVPFYSLGLSNEFMYDGWNRQFNYQVMQLNTNNHMTNSSCIAGSNAANNNSSSQYVCFRGQASGSSSYPYNFQIERVLNGSTVIWDAAYVLVSYGEDGVGAQVFQAYQDSNNFYSGSSPNEQQNSPMAGMNSNPYKFVTTGYSYSSGSYTYNQFDDIVFFKTRNNLIIECNRNYNLSCTQNWGIQVK